MTFPKLESSYVLYSTSLADNCNYAIPQSKNSHIKRKKYIFFYNSIGLKHGEYKTTICNCSNDFASKYIGLEILQIEKHEWNY